MTTLTGRHADDARGLVSDGPRRKQRREITAALIFGVLLAGFAVIGLLGGNNALPTLVAGGAIGFVVGMFLVLRRRRGAIPAYVRQFASDQEFRLSNSAPRGFAPILQQPFSRYYGVASGALFADENIRCSVTPYDYVREHRWHLEMLARIAFRIWGEPRAMKFTATIVELPQARTHLPVLLCERRYGAQLLDPVEDAVRRLKRLDTESVELGQHREIFVLPDQEPVWVHRLFSPSFIQWHTSNGDDVAWELVDGQLCVTTDRRNDTVEELERCFYAAADVAKRLLDEVEQTTLATPIPTDAS